MKLKLLAISILVLVLTACASTQHASDGGNDGFVIDADGGNQGSGE